MSCSKCLEEEKFQEENEYLSHLIDVLVDQLLSDDPDLTEEEILTAARLIRELTLPRPFP